MILLSPGNLFWLSLSLYLLAAILALVLVRQPRLANRAAQAVCMLASLTGLGSSLVFLLTRQNPLVIAELASNVPFMTVQITLDSLSSFFLLALSVLVFAVSLYSISYMDHYAGKKNVGFFNFLYATFILSMALVLTSSQMVFFLVAWEAMSVISYFLVVYESEHEENLRAGTLYLIMTTLGTALLLIAFLLIYSYTGSFSLAADMSVLPPAVKNLLFILFLLGFGIKAGIVPLHIWLPAAHPAAPSNISALMSGVMIKTAIYGLLRFVLILLGADQAWWGLLLLAIGVLTAVIGVAFAYIDNNIKRLLAYSSIENIGIILIGLGTGFLALSHQQQAIGSIAIAAALFHTFNHTIFKGGLFLGAGSVHYATHSKNLEDLGGLIRKMPVTAVLVLGGSLAAAAMVPFNGFASEWLTLQAMFQSFGSNGAITDISLMLAVAGLGLAGALAAASYLKLFSVAFLGKGRTDKAENAREVPLTMRLGQGILVVLGLVFGLFPALFVSLAEPVVAQLTGLKLTGLISGWFGVTSGAAAGPTAISPLTVIIAMALLIGLIMLVLRLAGGKYIERRYGTWDCGYEALTARMQYSSTGFAKPVKIVFRFLFRPSRHLKTGGRLTYHPESLEYSVTSESLIEKYFYDPIVSFSHKLSHKTRSSVQTGSIRRYLAYILLALIAVMLYNLLYQGVI